MKFSNTVVLVATLLSQIVLLVQAQELSLPSCGSGCPASVCPASPSSQSCLCDQSYDFGYCIGYNCFESEYDINTALLNYESYCDLSMLPKRRELTLGGVVIPTTPRPTSGHKNSAAKPHIGSVGVWICALAISFSCAAGLF